MHCQTPRQHAAFSLNLIASDKIRQYNGEIYIKFAITMENFTDGLYPTRITTANS